MRFSCMSCGATFQTAAGAAPKATFACPACGGEMATSADVVELHQDRVPTRRYDAVELRARLELEKEESARTRGTPRSAGQIWFAAVQGRQVGPLTPAGLHGLRARGQLQAATLVWREGWPAWVAAEAVAELRPVLGLAEAAAAHASQGARASVPAGTDLLRPGAGDLTAPGRPSSLPFHSLAAPSAAPSATSAVADPTAVAGPVGRGGAPAGSLPPQSRPRWFAEADEGHDFDPRRVTLAVALAVALLLLALLVKAR
jgi:GYF domain 2